MPRDIPVGNGHLLVCFDAHYAIRDLYFPHVGQENHVSGDFCRFGVWVDGVFRWIGADWRIDLLYEPDTMVTQVNLLHPELGVLLTCRDAVDFHENIYLRQVTVENLRPEDRELRLFFAQSLNISGNSVGDTAAFDPETGGIVHYKGSRYFLAGGTVDGSSGFSQFAVGQKKVNNREGTYRDAEDGTLSGNTIAQGSVDSVAALHLTVKGHDRGTAYYWLTAGENWREVRRLDGVIKRKTPQILIQRTADYWQLWVRKEMPRLDILPATVANLYRRSLLVLRTQLDWQGGILAANDSDVIQFNRDTYSYIWPRDGALAANALDLAGYPMPAQRFYEFCGAIIERQGYFLHKYNPDGTLASSWHPWLNNGQSQLPIQEDETALVIWALWNHFVLYRDIEFIKPLYLPLIKNAADFMCRYRDQETGLPAPSYDLWEERRGILSFTTGAVFGGLTAASLFCSIFGEEEKAGQYQQVASEIRDAASNHLWRTDLGRFCRMVSRDGNGTLRVDPTCDSSLWGLFAFGLYTPDDPRIEATMKALRQTLWINTAVGGMARYEGDAYHRTSNTYPGNPWFLCTLWLADYLANRATTDQELTESFAMLAWVADHAMASGVLAEQVHPETGQPLSVSPLTWSHATFVATTQRILRQQARMHPCPACGNVSYGRPHEEDWLAALYGKACDAIRGICKVH
ncbi:MAG: glycoside hydrolase family 15 protein [Thermodesulfobacteriota bacterium]